MNKHQNFLLRRISACIRLISSALQMIIPTATIPINTRAQTEAMINILISTPVEGNGTNTFTICIMADTPIQL